ncbi:MAG: DUF1189 family protein [Fibrobacter sp.]|nr:DUF1189 family protein [Fibrobacter sp.]
MSFFKKLHRSIVDPLFYKEVLTADKWFIAGFLFQLLLLTSLLTSLSQVYYMLDDQRGIAKPIEMAFPETKIVNGKLKTALQLPYTPPKYLIMPVFDQLFGVPGIGSDSDSLLILDTARTAGNSLKVPTVIMGSEKLFMFLSEKTVLQVPYKILLGNGKFTFKAEQIRSFFVANLMSITLFFFFASLTQNFFMIFFSVSFLAVAGYLFRVERGRSLGHYLRTACFAVSPICVGSILVGFSGVKLFWTWHILIFISTIVMFRAITASGKPADKSGELL